MTARQERPVSTRVYVGIIAVLVVVIVVGGALLIWRPWASPEPTPTPTPAVTVTETAGDPLANTKNLSITVGGGGSAVSAADGVTPVGYSSSCKGAVYAATNASVALNAYRVYNDDEDLSQEQFIALYEDLTTGQKFSQGRQTDQEFFSSGAGEGTRLESHPEWGGFRVIQCIPGQTATVDVHGAVGAEENGGFSFSTVRYQMVWQAQDWLVTATEAGTQPEIEVGTMVPGYSDEYRASIEALEGWQVYQR